MIPIPLRDVAEFCGGEMVAGDPAAEIVEVCTDTRSIAAGALFVALVGERYDAHDFVQKAAEVAGCCIVSRLPEGYESLECGFIKVEDTLVALQQLARRYREGLDIKVVCITGSNGKTSTKDLIKSVLCQRFEVNATKGNFNNHIGLPLTILETGAEHQIGVWEIGMSNPGEIAPLAAIAQPDVAVITNVGTAHIEFMGSRDAIALEKGALAESVGSAGSVVLNANDDYTPEISSRTAAAVRTAGIGQGDVRAESVEVRGDCSSFQICSEEVQTFGVELPVPGQHMVANATLSLQRLDSSLT